MNSYFLFSAGKVISNRPGVGGAVSGSGMGTHNTGGITNIGTGDVSVGGVNVGIYGS